MIVVSQVGLTFAKVQNGGNPLPQNITILNSGTGSMDWTATVKMLTGSSWLSLSRASGTVVRPSVDFSSVDVIVDGRSLAPGKYFGQIQVRSTNANNSPQTVSVILNVLPPNSKLGPEVRPTGLVFIGTADSAPGSQTVQVANRGSGTLNFKSTRLNYGNVVWFTSVPTVGAVAANQPATLTVQPDLSARSPGVDRGVITLLFDDGSIQTVDILPWCRLPVRCSARRGRGKEKTWAAAAIPRIGDSGDEAIHQLAERDHQSARQPGSRGEGRLRECGYR